MEREESEHGNRAAAAAKRDLRARIRRWARMLQERGHDLPAG